MFLKGCPLRCFWCCNPESQRVSPEISRNAKKCLGPEQCGICLQVCEAGALSLRDGEIHRDRKVCIQCGACATSCPSGSVIMIGRWMTVDEVVHAINTDAVFYYHSGGGFTLSGGEPLLQAEFAAAVCRQAVEEGLSPSLETCAYVPYESMRKVCAFMTHVLVDVKQIDPVRHQQATGMDNHRILANIRQLCRDFPSLPVTIRVPIIPGFNDNPADVTEIARFAGGFAQARLELLPYHRLGEDKYKNLARGYSFAGKVSPSSEQMAELRSVAGAYADMT